MKHPSLQHLPRKERWFRLQQFNGTWIGNLGLLIFVAVGIAAFILGSILMVGSGLTSAFTGSSGGPLLATAVAVPALIVAALAWEAFRRWTINRALDRSQPRRCPCGYDIATLTGRCPECGRDIP